VTNCSDKQQEGGWWEDQLANRCSFPIAPVNTFTNIAYMLAGAYVMWNNKAWGAAVECVMLVLLGIGSGVYHGFKTHFAGACDDAGMFLVFGAMTVYAYAPASEYTPFAMIVGGGSLAIWRFLSEEPATYLHVLLGVFIGGATMAGTLHGHPLQALGGLALLALGYFGCWQPDQARHFPLPRWGHGLWHILTAAGIAVLFLSL